MYHIMQKLTTACLVLFLYPFWLQLFIYVVIIACSYSKKTNEIFIIKIIDSYFMINVGMGLIKCGGLNEKRN